MKVSFDFDSTLSFPNVQLIAHNLIKTNHDVHIVTSRQSNNVAGNPRWNDDLFLVASSLNIPDQNIHFCNLTPKYRFFSDNKGFGVHLDDEPDDVHEINTFTDTKAILFVQTYDNTCLRDFMNQVFLLNQL